MAKLANKFRLGCDPEFVALGPKGQIINVHRMLSHAGPVGWDHNGRVVELRPEPARGAWSLVKRLQALLQEAKPIQKYRWRAGAYYEDLADGHAVTLGGHIHFDFPKGSKDLINALDCITQLLEHLEVLPKAECDNRRHSSQYGKMSDIRICDGHIEYRSMASWLYDPYIAFLAITLAKLAAVAPAEALTLSKKTSVAAMVKFLEGFSGKDINADRLLDRFERDKKWISKSLEDDFRSAWEGPLC